MTITLDGTAGITTPGLTNTGTETLVNLTTTGNTTLGDATTDTLTVGVTGIVKDASGNVGIGTATPSTYGKFAVVGADGYISASVGSTTALTQYIAGDLTYICSAPSSGSNGKSMVFQTGTSGLGTERMRIDSSGNLLIGGNPGSNIRLYSKAIDATSSNYGIYIQNTTPADLLWIRNDGVFNTGNAPSSPYNATTASAANVFVSSSGQLQRSTSSFRYKENVQDYGKGLFDLAKLRPVTFNSKSKDADENPDMHTYAGFIAEEVDAAGLTEFVQYNSEGQPDALAYSNMVALLTKAIQEMKAIIDTQANTIQSITTRITALETK